MGVEQGNKEEAKVEFQKEKKEVKGICFGTKKEKTLLGMTFCDILFQS